MKLIFLLICPCRCHFFVHLLWYGFSYSNFKTVPQVCCCCFCQISKVRYSCLLEFLSSLYRCSLSPFSRNSYHFLGPEFTGQASVLQPGFLIHTGWHLLISPCTSWQPPWEKLWKPWVPTVRTEHIEASAPAPGAPNVPYLRIPCPLGEESEIL